MAAYYPPPPGLHATHGAYYQPPPPPLGVAQPPPPGAHHPSQYYTLPQPQPQPPTPPPAYVPQPYAQPLPQDEVRTLFIAGLPEDVQAREIYNLFREFPGYESSHLRNPTSKSQAFAFAVFLDQQSAIAALHGLNGMVFDLEKGSTLYIDFARSNSRSKRARIDDERYGSDKRTKGAAAYPRGVPDSGVGSIHMPGLTSSAYNIVGYPPTQSVGSYDVRGVNEISDSKSNVAPCPTLFVANLGPTCSEQELIQVFSRCRGYLKLKMQSTYGPPVAFVDFQDTACSMEARSHLQGTILYSSRPGEGMRLEYAKSRMGMRGKKSR